MDDIELAFEKPEVSDDTKPDGEEAPELDADGNPVVKEEELDADGKPVVKEEELDENGQPKPKVELGKDGKPVVKLPKELEPFAATLKSRKWDAELANPTALLPKVLKSYTELESHASREGAKVKTTQERADMFANLARGSIEDINKFREAQGLPTFKGKVQSLADRQTETDTLIENMNKVLSGEDKDGAAYNALNKHFATIKSDLEFERRYTEKNPGKTSDQAFGERKTNAQSVHAALVAENNEHGPILDLLDPYLQPGGVLFGMGIDHLDVLANADRAKGFLEIAKALHTQANLESIVQAKVKAELARRKTAKTVTNNGGRSTIPNTKPEKELDLSGLMG